MRFGFELLTEKLFSLAWKLPMKEHLSFEEVWRVAAVGDIWRIEPSASGYVYPYSYMLIVNRCLREYRLGRSVDEVLPEVFNAFSSSYEGDKFTFVKKVSIERASWKISFPKEFTDVLDSNKYSYHIDNGTLIIDHKGYVNLNNLTTLPNNIQFNNEGYVDLSSLTTLPNNVQFNNKENVYLHSLTTLPDNVQFNNEGYVNLNSLTTLPNNIQFNNKGKVYLDSLTTLPNNKEQIFKNYGYRVLYNNWDSTWTVPNRVEGSKLESKLSWKVRPQILEVGDRVKVVLNSNGNTPHSPRFVGATGVIRECWGDTFKWAVTFDSDELDSMSRFDGGYLWRDEDLKLLQKRQSSLPGSETYENYNSVMEVQPPELLNLTPTVRKEKNNLVDNSLDDSNERNYFEKGQHQTLNRPETSRPIIPFGSSNVYNTKLRSLSWKIIKEGLTFKEFAPQIRVGDIWRRSLADLSPPYSYMYFPEDTRNYQVSNKLSDIEVWHILWDLYEVANTSSDARYRYTFVKNISKQSNLQFYGNSSEETSTQKAPSTEEPKAEQEAASKVDEGSSSGTQIPVVDIWYPSVEDVYNIHEDVLEVYGGSEGCNELTSVKIEAAIGRMQSGFGETEFYPSLVEKTAVLIHSLTTTHPFTDANKRTAFVSGIRFLHHNGLVLSKSLELAKLIEQVADDKAQLEHLVDWLREHAKDLFEHHEQGIQHLTWKINSVEVGDSVKLLENEQQIEVCRAFWKKSAWRMHLFESYVDTVGGLIGEVSAVEEDRITVEPNNKNLPNLVVPFGAFTILKKAKKVSWKLPERRRPSCDDPESYIGWLVRYNSSRGDRYWVVSGVDRDSNSRSIYLDGFIGFSEEDALEAYRGEGEFDNGYDLKTLQHLIVPIRYVGGIKKAAFLDEASWKIAPRTCEGREFMRKAKKGDVWYVKTQITCFYLVILTDDLMAYWVKGDPAIDKSRRYLPTTLERLSDEPPWEWILNPLTVYKFERKDPELVTSLTANLKLSWKISFPKEFTDLLDYSRYSYHIDNGSLIIDHEGDVYLPNLTTLPNNVQFNNEGYVSLYGLATLPNNIQFNNKGNVYLLSLTTLPNNIQFNNKGYVSLHNLTTLPDNKEQIFKNYGYKIWYNEGNSSWIIPNRVEGSKLSWKVKQEN